MIFQRTLATGVILLWLLLLPITARASYSADFRGLGDLVGQAPSLVRSQAYDVSDDGTVVVGLAARSLLFDDDGNLFTYTSVPVRWQRQGGIAPLAEPPVTADPATAVSADGSYIVTGGMVGQAFRWHEQSGFENLGGLGIDSFNSSHASDVTADGSVVVGFASAGILPGGHVVFEAFRWTETAGMQRLGVMPGGLQSIAEGVSADGTTIVGASNTATGTVAVRWSETGEMMPLGHLDHEDRYSAAEAVSASGSIIVGSSGPEAFRWQSSTGMTGLGHLLESDDYSTALDVSADGSVIVGSSGEDAFVWSELEGMRRLHDVLNYDLGLGVDGWRLTAAVGVSADGSVIVGRGVNPFGGEEAWIAILPEPQVVPWVAIGFILVGARGFRRIQSARLPSEGLSATETTRR